MKYFLLSFLLVLSLNSSAQYNILYESRFRHWYPGQGWVMLDNDTIPKPAGLIVYDQFGGIGTLYQYMLGIDNAANSATDKVMITPAFVAGNQTFARYFSGYTAGAELSAWVIPNHNDTTLAGLTDSLCNSNPNGFNVINLSAYAGDTIRMAFRLRGLIKLAFIDDLLILDKHSLAWVPDSCFRSYLKNTSPSAFAGDSMNFLDSSVVFRTTITNPNSCMNSLEGLQYFVNLRYLDVQNNTISYIPSNPINYLDSANATNNFLPLFPDVPSCRSLRLNNNLIKYIPDVYNGSLFFLQMKNNMVYDCFTCSNRFVYGDLTNNIYTTKDNCFYYHLQLTPNPPSLPAPECYKRRGTIRGKAYYDINQTGAYEMADILLGNQKINYFQGGDITTFLSGNYGILVDSGQVNMSLTDLPPGFTCNTDLYDTIDAQETIVHDFIVMATANRTDLSVSVNSTGTTRLNESLTLSLNVKNRSTQAETGTVKMYLRPGYTLLNIQNGSINNDTLTWNISLNPFAAESTILTIRIDSFPVNQTTTFTADLFVLNDIDTTNNHASTGVMILDSLVVLNPPTGFPFDPNNKLVDKPIVTPGFQDYLTYNINFENIGTANASRVMVRDFISGKLDINSFELLSTSHPCIVSYGADSLIQFLFDPIVLTYTSADPLNSQGHIWFRIKPKNPVTINDTIYNSATIFFDTQPGIVTNESMVYVSDTIPGAAFTADQFYVCMNSNRNVRFRNQSGNLPLSVEWIFPGGTPSTSVLPNPVVNYPNVGDYDVTLIAKYQGYNDTLFKPAYIHVVPVSNPTVIYSSNDTICPGDSVQLSTGSPAVSYLWSNGSTAPYIYVSTTSYIYITVTDSLGCKTSNYDGKVTVIAEPVPVISGLDTICDGSSDSLSVSAFSTYLWSTGESSQQIQPHTTGSYIVTVQDAYGCEGSDTFDIHVLSQPAVLITGPDTICSETHAVLDAGSGFANYQWSTQESTAQITAGNSGLYSVTITDVNGCSNSASHQLYVIPVDTSVSVNGFTLMSNATAASWQWMYCDSTLISNANSGSFIPAQNGSYAVIVIENGCIDTSSCYTMLVSGIGWIDNVPVNLYPNPADKFLTIEGFENAGINSVIIYSSTGQIVKNIQNIKNSEALKIDLSSFVSGLYVVELVSNTDKMRTRLIVRHE